METYIGGALLAAIVHLYIETLRLQRRCGLYETAEALCKERLKRLGRHVAKLKKQIATGGAS